MIKKKYDIVISMGGSDPKNLSLMVTKSLSDLNNLNIKIILGPFFKKFKELYRLTKNKKNITIIKSPKKIWKEFFKSDVVICNAGSTLYELAIQQVPTISISSSKHQIPYATTFALKNTCLNLGYWKNLNSDRLKKVLLNLLKNSKKRQQLCISASKVMDGKGTVRVTNKINQFLLKK